MLRTFGASPVSRVTEPPSPLARSTGARYGSHGRREAPRLPQPGEQPGRGVQERQDQGLGVEAVAARGARQAPYREGAGDLRRAPRGPRQAPRRILQRRAWGSCQVRQVHAAKPQEMGGSREGSCAVGFFSGDGASAAGAAWGCAHFLLLESPIRCNSPLCSTLPSVGLALKPLSGALAAGNAVAVKPSELAPSTVAFLAANIPRYLDAKAVKVVQGGSEVREKLMEHRWDKVLFTGSARVGRIIMAKAAKHLTPAALELGSKCPCIVDLLDSKRDSQVAVNRVIGAKWSTCAGQACIAIDYILVEEQFAPILIELLKSTLERFFTKPEYMARIVNEKQFRRLSSLLEDHKVGSSIVHGGYMDPKTSSIEPTILLKPPIDSDIMTEEIFGPLLPIITVKKIEDSIEFMNSMPKPLAIYAFTTNEELKQRIIKETSSGSVTFNDAIVQYGLESIPFGGVGESGFGQYHGKYSFEMFSHKKAVFKRSFLIEFMFRYPLWDDSKLGLLRHVFRYDYVLLFLALLGLSR